MKSQDTWDEANRFSANLLLVGSVAYFFLMMLCVPFIQGRDIQILIPTGFLILYLFGIIFVVERRLKKLFDESGRRKDASCKD